jgi:DNA-binding PadR family transcriptional regulator
VALEYAILGFLSERPYSGYDLKTRCFGESVMTFWNADQAQIYRTLERLQKERLVTSTRRRQTGRPDRRVFEITAAGREALDSWLGGADELPPLRDPLFLRLWFGTTSGDENLMGVLRSRRLALEEHMALLRAASAELAENKQLPDRAQVLRQTAYDGAIARDRASIEWLDECIAAIDQGVLPGFGEEGIGQRFLFGDAPA